MGPNQPAQPRATITEAAVVPRATSTRSGFYHDGQPPAAALTTVWTPLPGCFPLSTNSKTTIETFWSSTTSCAPPGWDALWDEDAWEGGYYSPGICPSGWTVGCTRYDEDQGPTVEPGETAYNCVLSGYDCNLDMLSILASNTELDYQQTMLQIRWAESDLSTLETHPLTPGKTWEPTTSAPAPTAGGDDDGSDLSSGALVGIGIAAGAIAILLITAAVFFIYRHRKRRQAADADMAASMTMVGGGGGDPQNYQYQGGPGSPYSGGDGYTMSGVATATTAAGSLHPQYQQQQQQQPGYAGTVSYYDPSTGTYTAPSPSAAASPYPSGGGWTATIGPDGTTVMVPATSPQQHDVSGSGSGSSSGNGGLGMAYSNADDWQQQQQQQQSEKYSMISSQQEHMSGMQGMTLEQQQAIALNHGNPVEMGLPGAGNSYYYPIDYPHALGAGPLAEAPSGRLDAAAEMEGCKRRSDGNYNNNRGSQMGGGGVRRDSLTMGTGTGR